MTLAHLGTAAGARAARVDGAPPLVLLHAVPPSGRMWRGQVDGLGADYRLVVLPGAGHPTAAEVPGAFNDALRAFVREQRV